MRNVKCAEKLIADIDKAKANWNHKNLFTLKNVRKLSLGQLDILRLYAKTYIKHRKFFDLKEPEGYIEEVLLAGLLGGIGKCIKTNNSCTIAGKAL